MKPPGKVFISVYFLDHVGQDRARIDDSGTAYCEPDHTLNKTTYSVSHARIPRAHADAQNGDGKIGAVLGLAPTRTARVFPEAHEDNVKNVAKRQVIFTLAGCQREIRLASHFAKK